jgi:hypothetical protein
MRILKICARLLSIFIGWFLFVYWWDEVTQGEATVEILAYTGAALATAVITLAAMTTLWVKHNVKVARQGKRGRVTAYLPPRIDRDRLGRRLWLPPRRELLEAQVLRLEVDENSKAYLGEGRRFKVAAA